jgi:rare lipoprotein A
MTLRSHAALYGLLLAALLGLVACAGSAGRGTMTTSWYGDPFHGRPTASGERFNQNDFTAAHKTLPFGTRLRVTNPQNGQSVVVRINDRGPFVRGRDLDVSKAAAEALGIITQGVAELRVDRL